MDALELQRKLTTSGMEDELSRELIRFMEQRPELATKADLALLKKDIEHVEERMKTYVENAIGNLAWKVAGFLVAQAAVIVTLIKLL